MRMTLPAWPRPLPREARDTLFLLAVLGWILAMQVPQIPLWCGTMALGVLLWRAWIALRGGALPGVLWRWALVAGATLGTLASHQTLFGHEAGVTLIVVLLALKTLELRARRDAFVVFFLGFFTLLTHFFHSQSLLTALGVLVAFLGLLTALVLAHMPVGRPSVGQAARLAGGMALLGAPIMLVLFLFFPRFAPLWGIPTDSSFGRSGLSGEMQVGQIARLALDDSIAFRVEFLDGQRPAQDQLYFRGPVMSVFDGVQWRPQARLAALAPAPQLAITHPEQAIRYRLTMEPSNRPWVLTLEATPELPPVAGQAARLSPEREWTVTRPLTDLTRFEAVAYPHFRDGPPQRDMSLLPDLELPAGFNPRTLQWAQDLRREFHHSTDARRYIDAVLQHLRTGGYTYTLEPGLYGRHSADEFWFDRREGFCEHIASSFVVLMRALDIPARVVTGYHGGELNPIDGVWTVRQSDAHAWAEVWLPEQGWTRIDPTAYVAPARTESLSRLRPPPGVLANAMLTLHPDLLWRVRAVWEAANNRWNQWVLNYTASRQLDMLRQLGFRAPNWTDLVQVMVGALVLLGLLGAGWMAWSRGRQDPWLQLLRQAHRRLQRSGLELPAQHTTPRQMAAWIERHLPSTPAAAQWRDWLLALEAQRYDPITPTRLTDLRRQWRRLPALPRPSAPSPAQPSALH